MGILIMCLGKILDVAIRIIFSALLSNYFFPGQDHAHLHGTWVIVEVIDNGVQVPQDKITGTKVVFTKKDTMTFQHTNGEIEIVYTIKFIQSHNPKEINLIRIGGKKMPSLGIYQIEGDILRICASEEGANNRPTTFVSKAGSKFQAIKLIRDRKNRDLTDKGNR